MRPRHGRDLRQPGTNDLRHAAVRADGRLTNFVSDDRSRASTDGKSFTCLRFSTPVRDYRDFGSVRLASHGAARWLLPEGEFTYGEFELLSVTYNVPI